MPAEQPRARADRSMLVRATGGRGRRDAQRAEVAVTRRDANGSDAGGCGGRAVCGGRSIGASCRQLELRFCAELAPGPEPGERDRARAARGRALERSWTLDRRLLDHPRVDRQQLRRPRARRRSVAKRHAVERQREAMSAEAADQRRVRGRDSPRRIDREGLGLERLRDRARDRLPDDRARHRDLRAAQRRRRRPQPRERARHGLEADRRSARVERGQERELLVGQRRLPERIRRTLLAATVFHPARRAPARPRAGLSARRRRRLTRRARPNLDRRSAPGAGVHVQDGRRGNDHRASPNLVGSGPPVVLRSRARYARAAEPSQRSWLSSQPQVSTAGVPS